MVGHVPVMQQEEEAAKRQVERPKRPAKRVAVPKGTVRMQEPEVRATLCSPVSGQAPCLSPQCG